MATRNSRDVKLTLSVETLGESDVLQLQRAVQRLADEGGAAAPEFQRLADEIGRIGEQAQALQTYQDLAADVQLLAQRQETAAASAEQLTTALQAQRSQIEAARAAQKAAADALNDNVVKSRETTAALQQLRAAYRQSGDAAGTFAAEEKRLLETKGQLATANVGLAAANREANQSYQEASRGLATLETQQRSAVTTVQAAERALQAQETAMRGAADAAEALGVSTVDIAAAEASLLSALNGVSTAANRRQQETLDLVEADRLLAIEERTLIELHNRAQLELVEMTAAENRAAAGARAYAAAKAEALQGAEQWQREAEVIVETAEATARLARETQIAAAAAEELAAQRAFERQAQAARELVEAAGYVRFWEQALQEADVQARATATAAEQAAQRISNAFRTVGVRSVEELQQEINDTRAAMQTVAAEATRTGQVMSGAFGAGETKIRALEREMRELNGQLTTGDRLSKLFSNSLGQIAAGNLIADGVGFLVQKVKDLGTQFVVTIAETETFRKAMNAVYKDTAIAASQFQFLRSAANDAGVQIGAIQQSFTRFSAATKASNIPLEVTNDLFLSVTRTAGSLGLSADATAGALDALGQIASKSVVSLEELRQQLGDRMPAAMSAAASGLGLTEAQLIKLVESGQLAARDFFPAFAKGLRSLQGETEGLTNTWNRLANALTQSAQNAGDAGWTEVLGAGLRALGLAAGSVLLPLNALFELTGGLLRTGGALAAAAVTWTSPWQALQEIWSGAAQRQGDLTDAFDRAIKGGDAAAASALNLANTTQATTNAVRAAGAQWDTLTRSQQASAIAAELNRLRQGDLSAQFVGTTAVIQEMLVAQQKETEALGKQAKAAKEFGDTLVEIAAQRGNEAETLRTSAAAAETYAATLEAAAASQREEVALLEQQRAALVKTRDAQGQNTEATKQQTQELEKKLVTGRAEVAQAEASARAAQQEVAARRLAIQTYGDQSKKVVEYRAEMDRLTQVVREYERLNLEGKKTDAELLAVRTQLSEATVRYKDSVADSVTNLKLEATAKSQSVQASQMLLQSEADLLEKKAESYRLQGNITLAIMAEREAKMKRIEIDRLAIQIKEIELKLQRDELVLKLEDLKLSEPLNTQKQRELQLRIQLIDLQTKSLGSQRELLRLRQSDLYTTQQLTGAIQGENAARQGQLTKLADVSDAMAKMLMPYTMTHDLSTRQIKILEEEAAAVERLQQAYQKKWNMDKEHYSLNTAGERVMAGESEEDVSDDVARLYGDANRDNEKARRARQLRALARLRSQGNGLSTQPDLSADERRELQSLEAELLNSQTPTTPPGQRTAPAGTATTKEEKSTTGKSSGSGMSVVRLDVNLGGNAYAWDTDAAGAAEVTRMFRQLEQSSQTAIG